MTIIVLGGSSGLGRAVAERFAAERADLILVARDPRDLERVAADARTRHGVNISCVAGDLKDPGGVMPQIELALSTMPPLRGVVCAIGAVEDADTADRPDLIAPLTSTNFTGPSTIVSILAPIIVKGGFIVGIGSIAASRGRRRNCAYAAAKGALRLYFQSLRHTYWRDLLVQFYSAGYLDTNLAFGRRLPLAPASPPAFAAHIAHKVRRRAEGEFYFPWYWRYIGLFIVALPWIVFRRLNF